MGYGEGGKIRVLMVGPDPPPSGLEHVETEWVPVVVARPIKGSSLRVLEVLRGNDVDNVVFTSPRGPRFLAEDARRSGILDALLEHLEGRVVWAIGLRTAESIRSSLSLVPRVPPEYRGWSLAREIVSRGPRGVLGVRGTRVVRDLEDVLESHGVPYCEVHVYSLEPLPGSKELLMSAVDVVDAVLLTSPYIATVYHEILGVDAWDVPVVAIGPSTASRIRSLGGNPLCFPDEYTVGAALSCIARLLGGTRHR